MRAIALAAVLFLLAASAVYAPSGGAVEVSDSTILNGGAEVSSISCAAPGDCAAGGHYLDSSHHGQAFVLSETNGRWGKPIEVPGMATLRGGHRNASVDSISCAAPGDCAAGGEYGRFHHQEAFLVSERNGRWGKAIEVPGTATLNSGGGADVVSISCPAVGECAAGGSYSDPGAYDYQVFVVSERNGRWGKAIEVPGMATLNSGDYASVGSVSCATAGNCAAGGSYAYGGGTTQAFVVDETNGNWGTAIEVPAAADGVESISCAAAGECAAGGYHSSSGSLPGRAFVVSEKNGSWGTAIEVPGTAKLNHMDAAVDSISCAAAGECAAIGDYQDGGSGTQAFVVDETNGSWGNAIKVPGTATLNAGGYAEVGSISCAAVGECAAGGYYMDGSRHQQPFVVSEVDGKWGKAIKVPGATTLSVVGEGARIAISCAKAGDCAAGGTIFGGSGRHRAFVISETNGSWGKAIQVFPASCVVPNVVGKAIGAAKRRLNAAGCGVGKITYDYSNLQTGRVVAQQPEAGKIVHAGTAVALTVSEG